MLLLTLGRENISLKLAVLKRNTTGQPISANAMVQLKTSFSNRPNLERETAAFAVTNFRNKLFQKVLNQMPFRQNSKIWYKDTERHKNCTWSYHGLHLVLVILDPLVFATHNAFQVIHLFRQILKGWWRTRPSENQINCTLSKKVNRTPAKLCSC